MNACRSVLSLRNDRQHADLRVLLHPKSNLGPKAAPITCRIQGRAFVNLADDPKRQRECAEFTRDTIRAALLDGERLSPSGHAVNYAPKALHKRQLATDYSIEEIAAAVRALEDFLIERETYQDRGRERTAYRLCGASEDDTTSQKIAAGSE
jgi:hypothetical protein